MSHSRNSNSVQSQTELTDEDSDDDGDQTLSRMKVRTLSIKKYGSNNVKNNSTRRRNGKDEDNDDTDNNHGTQSDTSSESEESTSDSESDSYDSDEESEIDDVNVDNDDKDDDKDDDDDDDNDDDGTNDDECQSDNESNCELCCQAKTINSESVIHPETFPNGSTSSSIITRTKASASNTKDIPKVNSFGMKNVRSNQVQSYISDSTKNVNPYPVKHWMAVGKTVFVRWTNGLYYLGVIEKIESDRGLCLVRYEDDSQYWTHFKDIHTQLSANTIFSDSDIICSECRDGSSKSPNEIVICDVCNQGYHQLCHKPQIPDSILEPDAPWTCRTCLYALGAREGGAERDTAVGEAMKLTKTVFHYDITKLTWNDTHQSNRENIYCYCGGPGRYHSRMLQCHKCFQWFHEACIQEIESPFFYGDHFYKFTCGVCNNGEESVERIAMRWSDLVSIVLNNLTLQHQKRFFDLSSEIVPFIIENNSKFKTKGYNMVKMNEDELTQKILSVLTKYKKKFFCDRDRDKLTHWALRVPWPFPWPQFYAPKTFWSNCDKHLTQTDNNVQSMNNPIRSRSPPAFPLIYGACRKGASIYPKPASMRHLVRHKERKRSRRKSQEKGKSKLNVPGTSSIHHHHHSRDKRCSSNYQISTETTKLTSSSSSSSGLTPSKEIPESEREHLRTKIKITSNCRWKSKRPRSEYKDQHSDDIDCGHEGSSQDESTGNGDNDNRDLGSVDACLEKVIPLPENFEGHNNPFFDINEQSESSTSSSTVNPAEKGIIGHSSSSSQIPNPNDTNHNPNNNQHESGYQIIRSGTCSKLTLKRITGHQMDKESPSKLTSKSTEVEAKLPHREPANDSSPRKCIIKAQRLTAEGKLEYLLEWE